MSTDISEPPENFSWVVEHSVCAFAFPRSERNLQYLLDHNVYYLLSLTEEVQPNLEHFSDIKHHVCEIEEFAPPSLSQVEDCLDFIESANAGGKAVGIHCFHGWGRTGTILACYFVKTQGMDARQAILEIRTLRPWSVETRAQEKIVFQYERKRKNSLPCMDEQQKQLVE